ncbi:MAG: TaqI-like C-terminal specificity domain-containing protein [Bacteroidales bacterium]|jgi:adenine-specific DNA-methyltransferase
MTPDINFNDSYKRDKFLPFLEWFLPDDFIITEEKFDNLNFTTKYTEEVTKLGTCPSLELDVYEITHTSTHDARVGIAQDAFRLMLYKSYNNRALVIFKPENSRHYRFSLLQIEAEQVENSARITRSYSNPRRYSFQLGESAHVKTPTQFLLEKGKLVKKNGSYFNDLQERFSVEVLTKQFYKELSDWYFWALRHVEFPSKPTYEDSLKKDKPLEEMVKEHNATNVIRMLTRLLFVWFIKQKGLIPEELFDVEKLENNILTELNPVRQDGLFAEMSKESVYYKAILQNLFFASLNCPIKPQSGDEDKRERGFRRKKNYGDDFGNDWLFRYEKYFKDPDGFVELINSKVPFLNGGLFECLDDKANKKYIDGFSDNLPKPDRLIVPDYLFFGKDESVDLSEDYGDTSPQYKHTSVKGLINILKTYNFTVEENTPAEIVVALDPELLGKVFENLLASYNPETKTTARKQTGSFYTPREIVNYMVDESLIAYIKGKTNIDEKNIRVLFQYSDEEHELSTSQIEELINSIYECKILDPACGSGAFPMGVLQKLVHVLQKVDPENYYWKKVQNENAYKEIQKALDIEDRKDRENRLIEINNAFDVTKNRPDYARKLYLIENCIYGVDIQPIAIQISKLRFFISLVVDQNNNFEDENFGIIPLPNLETKFVAANTLIGINRPSGLSDTDEIRKLQEELRVCRHKIFNAKTTKTKKKWRKIDKEKRYAIAAKLKENGWDNDNADMLANWDPYDQNASSPFFDPEWMFGLQRESGNSKSGEKGGYFDIVIGNPPYGAELTDEEKSLYRKIYREIKFKINTYTLFVLNSIKLLKNEGISYFIIPNTLLDNYFEDSVREKLLTEYCILEINDLDDKVFDAAVVHSMIFAIKKKYCANYNVKVNTGSELNLDYFYIPSSFFIRQDNYAYNIRNYSSDKLITKLNDGCEKLFDVLDIRQAIKTGNDKIYLSDQKIDETYKPILRGKDIYRYGNSNPNLYVQYGKHLACPRNPSIFEQPKILIREAGSKIIATLDYNNFYIMSSLYNGISKDNDYDLRYLLGLINSKLFQYLINKLTFEKTKGAFTKAKIFHYYGLPVKVLTITQQEPIIALVNQILQIKQKNSQANTSVLEKQIDLLIYKLYDLTYEEVKIIDPDFDLTEKEYISNNYYVK